MNFDNPDDWLALALIAFFTFSSLQFVWRYFTRHRLPLTIANTSILLRHYGQGRPLVAGNTFALGDLTCTAYAFPNTRATMYRVILPYKSKVHLLGVPTHSGVKQLRPAGRNSLMEKVDLEGNYYKFFSLYAEKDQQTDVRYVLDPLAMAFSIDFCRSHNWEIVESELYFVQATQDHPEDPTAMSEDIETFVEQIRPALEIPLSASEMQNIAPYGQDVRSTLKCPICSHGMQKQGVYFTCSQHGMLLRMKTLFAMRDGELAIPDLHGKSVHHGTLTCPGCGSDMHPVDYNGSSVNIDSCNSCGYRWLDIGEMASLRERYSR